MRQYYDYLYKIYYNKEMPKPNPSNPEDQCKLLGNRLQIKEGLAPHDSLLSSVGTTEEPE